VTTDPSIAQDKNDVSMPAGAKPFDSGFIPPGQSWSYTFTLPGRYLYACVPHCRVFLNSTVVPPRAEREYAQRLPAGRAPVQDHNAVFDFRWKILGADCSSGDGDGVESDANMLPSQRLYAGDL